MRVSIGIPFYNAERTLADAIRSVVGQGYSDWELILLDDGSTDGSLAIANAVHDPRVRVITDGTNCGLIHRLNELTDLARGDYYLRMDSDDLMHPDRVQRQVAYLNTHPEIDLVGTAVCTIDAVGAPTGKRGFAGPAHGLGPVLRHGLFVHPTIAGRLSWFRKYRYSDAYHRAEDHELWCRTASVTRAALIPEVLMFYREPVPVKLAAYEQSCRTERRIIREFGPRALGTHETWKLLALHHLKPRLMRAAAALGLQQQLVSRRNVPLTSEERAGFELVLDGIRRTAVSGL